MTKDEPRAIPVWDRVSKNARMGSDGKRSLYVAARRLVAPGRAAIRSVAARRGSRGAGLAISSERGFVVYGPDHFSESRESVEVARQRFAEVDADGTRERGKPFMVPILDQGSLTRDSPLVRLALRPDVLGAVAAYLRVAPILSSIDVYYSRSVDRELMSSQLLHCDGDDTRQIKIFVLCTPVDRASGPLMIMDADRSEALRRKLGYEYRNRVADEEARAAMGGLSLNALEGEPGTTCFVDTSRCFHYGSRVEAKDEGRLVAIIQYLTPYSFMLPRDYWRAAPYRHLVTRASSRLERLVLGAG
jgi:hypothetical protein